VSDKTPVVVVVVKPGAAGRQPVALLRWLRWLLPAALLVVSPMSVTFSPSDEVITLNADEVDEADSGPLAVADAIMKARERR
jgi:hypothetical protein